MATLTDSSGRVTILRPNHLVGRSRAMNTVIAAREVSAQHAAFTWTVRGWTLRDLGSRNGTFIGGRRLGPVEIAPLKVGDELSFGGPRFSYTVSSIAPPAPSATCGDRVVEGDEEYLALPSEEDPAALIVHEPEVGWTLADGGGASIADGDCLEICGDRWIISLPEMLMGTVDSTVTTDFTLENITLDFAVSSDEEYVEITADLGGVSQVLKPRAYHYLVLTLARQRLKDAAEGLPEAEQGWIYTTDLTRMLRASSNQIYVSVHRARKQLEELGVRGGRGLIEKRATTRQLRLGVGRVTVRSL
jgi:hypothetical protein